MRYLAIRLLLFFTASLVVADNMKIENVYITTKQKITIPKIKNDKLKDFSFSIKDKKLKPFYIAKYETTIKQYITYQKANNIKIQEMDEDTLAEPMTNIDYKTASKVCNYYGGRLPTEFEWVVSASIKLTPSKCYRHIKKNSFVPYPTVNYPLNKNSKQIKYMLDEDDELEVDLIGSELLEVKDSYENINGIYGMLGNVWEWVDSDKMYFNEKYKTLKGGSFANFEQKELFDSRISNFLSPDAKMNSVGFRCVWDIKK